MTRPSQRPAAKDDGPHPLIVDFRFQITDPTTPFDVLRVHAR
ncbi:hypothetical protein [Streptomyces sp. NPDC021562]